MIGDLNNTPEDLTGPFQSTFHSDDDETLMDRLIRKLVILQGALYPHHKVTEDILMKQKIIEVYRISPNKSALPNTCSIYPLQKNP